ncbi:MAG: type IV pilin protein [Porticoccaceae bacterium]
MPSQPKAAGFSLLELMIVIVIVAILAAVAYPSYQQHIVRTKRAAAQQYLLEVSSLQHQFILDNHSYATTLSALGTSPATAVGDNYTVTITGVNNTASPPTFTLQAAPKSGTTQQGSDTLTVNHLGQKNATWYD